jgi:hypothetical protein
VADLATRHTRLVASGATDPGLIASDPEVRQLLLHMRDGLARLDLLREVTYLLYGKSLISPGGKGTIGPIAW